MRVVVLDTVTGQTAVSEGVRTFEWKLNNYSCDCNRETLFGVDTSKGFCIGSKRYIVISAEVETGDDYPSSAYDLNAEYPNSLLAKHGIKGEETND